MAIQEQCHATQPSVRPSAGVSAGLVFTLALAVGCNALFGIHEGMPYPDVSGGESGSKPGGESGFGGALGSASGAEASNPETGGGAVGVGEGGQAFGGKSPVGGSGSGAGSLPGGSPSGGSHSAGNSSAGAGSSGVGTGSSGVGTGSSGMGSSGMGTGSSGKGGTGGGGKGGTGSGGADTSGSSGTTSIGGTGGTSTGGNGGSSTGGAGGGPCGGCAVLAIPFSSADDSEGLQILLDSPIDLTGASIVLRAHSSGGSFNTTLMVYTATAGFPVPSIKLNSLNAGFSVVAFDVAASKINAASMIIVELDAGAGPWPTPATLTIDSISFTGVTTQPSAGGLTAPWTFGSSIAPLEIYPGAAVEGISLTFLE